MKIQEMHELFRVLGQRMGLQNIRAIIPEEIDVLINDAIITYIKQVIQSNATLIFDNNVLQHNTPIGYLNPIRTLYKSVSYKSINYKDVMYYVSFSCALLGKGYKCRLVEADRVDDMNADYCSRASVENPIVTMLNDSKGFLLKVYPEDIKYDDVIIRYIKNPVKVVFGIDENGEFDENLSVDSDMPDYTHDDIVKLAITQYFQSLKLTTQQPTNK